LAAGSLAAHSKLFNRLTEAFNLLNNLDMKDETNAVMVPAVVQAVSILRYLARADSPQGLTRIARELHISPSSCFNLLKTLAAERFVEFESIKKTYTLGAGLDEVARAPGQLIERIRPDLEALAAKHEIASGLWSVTNGRLVLESFVASELATRIHMTVGQRLPMYIGAMGRCLAAQGGSTATQVLEEVQALRWARRPTIDRYRRELAQVRRQGWAIDDGDFMAGVTTIAAPIVDANGRIRYCIANTLFQGQLSVAALQGIGMETARLAQRFSVEVPSPKS
jgi:DNA-binding IclR family transcriptional regulator